MILPCLWWRHHQMVHSSFFPSRPPSLPASNRSSVFCFMVFYVLTSRLTSCYCFQWTCLVKISDIPFTLPHNHFPFQRSFQRIRPNPRPCVTIRYKLSLLRWGVISSSSNLQAVGPPTVVCSLLLIWYILPSISFGRHGFLSSGTSLLEPVVHPRNQALSFRV
jgi:hypothetical protein